MTQRYPQIAKAITGIMTTTKETRIFLRYAGTEDPKRKTYRKTNILNLRLD
jgi:hypothetical protein